jgi:HEAT repeat protein
MRRQAAFAILLAAGLILLLSCDSSTPESKNPHHDSRHQGMEDADARRHPGSNDPGRERERPPASQSRIIADIFAAEEIARIEFFRQRASHQDLEAPRNQESDIAILEQLRQIQNNGEDSDLRLDLLQQLVGSELSGATTVFLETLSSPHKEEVLVALEGLLLQKATLPPDKVNALLANEDSTIRALTVETFQENTPLDHWRSAASDASPRVRISFLEAIEEMPTQIKLPLAQEMLRSPDEDLRSDAAFFLSGTIDHQAIPLLINALDDPAAGEYARDGLRFLLGEDFDSTIAAQVWWKANQDRYDENLFPTEQ